ncbi:MAG: hypothetical protein ACK5NB_01985 [Flavobacteriaceae bacterium]
MNIVPVAATSGCGVNELENISINFLEQNFWAFPVTIVVKNSSGTTVQTDTYEGSGIWTSDDFPVGTYTVTVTDSCTPSNSITKTVDNPQDAGAPSVYIQDIPKWRCGTNGSLVLTQIGTTQVVIGISGYLPDRENVVVTITNGPSNVGVQGEFVDNQYWAWTNLLPGIYTISYTSCGVFYTGTFEIENNPNILLNLSLTSVATSFCTGGGSIASNFAYNGSYDYDIQLLDSSDAVVASNTTGSFSNIAPGTYTTRVRVMPCGSASYYYYIPGSTVTITNSSTGPKISSAIGVICEDADGNPLSTGTAYLDLNGVAPLVLQYRESGTTIWTTINPASANTQISGLTANTLYELSLSDGCGKSTNSSVMVRTIGTLSSSNTEQPCANAPYALTIPYYAEATYEWSNPAGTVVSNTRIYSIANYDASYDGTYICKISWSNCIERYVNVTLNSNSCGEPLGAEADLSITKTDGVDTYMPGTTVTYTIVVSNAGPDTVTDASVVDAVPTGIPAANVSYTAVVSTGSTTNVTGTQTGGINDLVTLPVNGTVTYTVTVNVPTDYTGDLVNTAAVTSPAGSTDPDDTNNTATDTDTQGCVTPILAVLDAVCNPGTNTSIVTYSNSVGTIKITDTYNNTITGANIVGNTITGIPLNTDFIVIATNGACTSTIEYSGVTSCTDPCLIDLSAGQPICDATGDNYIISFNTNVDVATQLTASVGTIGTNIVTIPSTETSVTLTANNGTCTETVTIDLSKVDCSLPCSSPVISIGGYSCNVPTWTVRAVIGYRNRATFTSKPNNKQRRWQREAKNSNQEQ